MGYLCGSRSGIPKGRETPSLRQIRLRSRSSAPMSATKPQSQRRDCVRLCFLEPSPDAQILSLRLTGFSATNTLCIDKKK